MSYPDYETNCRNCGEPRDEINPNCGGSNHPETHAEAEYLREKKDRYSYDYGKTGRIEFVNWRERFIHVAVSRLAAYFILGKDPTKQDENWTQYQKWRCNAAADWFILLWRLFRYGGSDNELGIDEKFKLVREAELWCDVPKTYIKQ